MKPQTWSEKLQWLQAHAHILLIEVNDHRADYEEVADAIADESVDDDVRAACVRRGHVVIVQCYPVTPIGFYRVVHFEIESAIERMFDLAHEELGLTTATPNREET